VLPDRIELSTSPLPMECSTTELRQRARDTDSAETAPTRRADPCHKDPARARLVQSAKGLKRPQSWFREGTGQQTGFTMKDDKNKPEGWSRNPARHARQDRLKLALRENLKRRKSQARGRDERMDASSDRADGSLNDAGGKKPDA
jgi:hypothetical protein